MENNEDIQYVEVSDELQFDEISEETSEAITLEDFETFNINYATGTLYTVGSLGVIAGALVASAFRGILKH